MNDKLVKEIQKEFKDDILVGPDVYKMGFIPSGSIQLDVAMGTGGWPLGRISCIAGQESSGKSTLAYSSIVNAQKMGLRCALIDAEYSFDPLRSIELGIDVSNLLVISPKSFEAACDATYKLASSGEIDFIVFDSIAGGSIKAQNEGSVEDANVGRKAKMLGNFLSKIGGPLAINRVGLLLINQLRAGLDMYGPKFLMPGGFALNYACSIIVWLKGKENKEGLGLNVHADVKKNKLAVPFKEVDYVLGFDGKIDIYEEVGLILAKPEHTERLNVTKAGAWYILPDVFGEERKFQGSGQIIQALKDEPEKLDELQEIILDKLTRKNFTI